MSSKMGPPECAGVIGTLSPAATAQILLGTKGGELGP